MKDHNIFSNANSQEIKAYRPDIDGLRAVAVIAVIIFHYWPATLKSGFIGVDIFFVISGFLITGIIVKDLNRNSFSFLNFFSKRVRRIFPALSLVLIFTGLLSAVLLFSDERTEISKQIIAGALFSYNFLAAKDLAYFNALEVGKPLLHLWSLGIEEQFYLLWPLMLLFAWQKKSFRKPALVGFFLLSFAANLIFLSDYPTMTFYLPFTRFWELLIGSALAVYTVENPSFAPQKPLHAHILSILGTVLIAVGFVHLQHGGEFPGLNALFPTVGAAFLIFAGPTAVINRFILANPISIFIGIISYPLYLWHWSFLIWGDALDGRFDLSTHMASFAAALGASPVKLIALILTFLASILTYHFVEKGFRFAQPSQKRVTVLFLLVVLVIPLLSCGQIAYNKFFAAKDYREKFLKLYALEDQNSEYHKNLVRTYHLECSFYAANGDAKPNIDPTCTEAATRPIIMLWGDSHVQHVRPGIDAILPMLTTETVRPSVVQITSGSCPASIYLSKESNNTAKACNSATQLAAQYISQVKPEILILGQASGFTQTNWKELTETVLKLGVKKIIILGPFPHWDMGLPQMVASKYYPNIPRWLSSSHVKPEVFEDDRTERKLIDGLPNVIYVSPTDTFCKDGLGCMVSLDDENRTIISHDSAHMTPEAGAYFAKTALLPILKEIIK